MRGTRSLRLVALQSRGSSGCRRAWGSHWGCLLKDLGADIGAVTETRIESSHQHALAIAGFLEAGYLALSHNVSPTEPQDAGSPLPGPRSAGVILCVKVGYVGAWERVERDRAGRAIAANLVLRDGQVARFAAVYGVTAACSPHFASMPAMLAAEQGVVRFIEAQGESCDANCWHLMVMGDLNSFSHAALDRIGPALVRDDCLSMVLDALWLRDTFRERHPALAAYTYVSATGNASRIDQVRCRAAPGCTIHIANAAILWAWPRQADHCPVVADLLAELPEVEARSTRCPPWRAMLAALRDPATRDAVCARAQDAIAPYEGDIRRAHADVSRLLQDELGLPNDSYGGLAPWYQNTQCDDPSGARHAIEAAHSAIEGRLASALPWTMVSGGSRRQRRATEEWTLCVFLLRELRHRVGHGDDLGADPARELLARIASAWRRARRLTEALTPARARAARQAQRLSPDSETLFQRSPSEWARARGFSAAGVPQAGTADPTGCCIGEPSTPLVGVPLDTGALRPSLASAQERRQALGIVNRWTRLAEDGRGVAFRQSARSYHDKRINALRDNDIGSWARMMKGPLVRAEGQSAVWLRLPDGTRRRPVNRDEAL